MPPTRSTPATSPLPAAIRRTFPLAAQWQTSDPFLFCAHHLDHYPPGNGRLGPQANLAGRSIGQDFAGIDGWNMYHGSSVPGFPQHPHRGFETVTYVRRGWCDHADSLGAKARFGEGDVQWLTAGAGIVHSEMFPLLSTEEPNTLHLFQIWLNLPPANKMVDPYFSMLWADEIPTVEVAPSVTATVIAGRIAGADGVIEAPAPPPDSWASGENGVEIWHVRLAEGHPWTLPPVEPGVERAIYFFDGAELEVAGHRVGRETGVQLDPSVTASLAAHGGDGELMVLSGRPIAEPVAQYGPFVMNDRAGIEQAFRDYQSTGFGGWPWPVDDPAHGAEARRFAQHPDGAVVTR